ncbi:unnamed protein product [Calypogeia fissa]
MAANVAGQVAGASTSLRSIPASRFNPQNRQQHQQDHNPTSALLGRGLEGRLRPKFAKSLKPLEITKVRPEQAYVHVQYVFKPGFHNNSLEPITVSVSTPLSIVARVLNPSRKIDLADQAELTQELNKLFKLPSPDREEVSVQVDIKRHPYADLQVGDRWQEFHGANDWDGLLSAKEGKIDPVFRGEMIRYGEFAQATYDAFDNDDDSKFCGNSKFDKEKLLEEVGLLDRGYEISEFIYATANSHLPKFFKKSSADDDEKWSKDSNFMGFVAVCTSPRELARLGRRDIVVAWRGTVTKLEWLENVRDFFSPTGMDPRGKSEVMVESGFLDVYKSKNENSRYNKLSAREQVLTAVRNLVQQYKEEELSITVTGHSLGSALSMICAYDIAESGINKRDHSPKVPQHWDEPQLDKAKQHPDHNTEPVENRVPVSVISFAGPRLGNSDFKERLEELGVKVLRVVEEHDMVPKVPGVIFNESLEFLHNLSSWLPDSYVHVGKELKVNSLVSSYLRDTTDPINAHNLEAYLHLLAGWHGKHGRFSPKVNRDIALVNKASDFLEPKLGVPENWWEKGVMMLDKETQRWVLSEDSKNSNDSKENLAGS